MFWCCCGNQQNNCLICQSPTPVLHGSFYILDSCPHPDYLSSGFFAQGLIKGTFQLLQPSDTFSAIFDYVNTTNYKELRFSHGITEDDINYLNAVLYSISGGSPSTLKSMELQVPSKSGLANFCVHFGISYTDLSTSHVQASVSMPPSGDGDVFVMAGSGFVLSSGGYVGYGGSGSIDSFYRSHADIYNCAQCEYPGSFEEECVCCPDGLAKVWWVDLTTLDLPNKYTAENLVAYKYCHELDRIYVLEQPDWAVDRGLNCVRREYEQRLPSGVNCGLAPGFPFDPLPDHTSVFRLSLDLNYHVGDPYFAEGVSGCCLELGIELFEDSSPDPNCAGLADGIGRYTVCLSGPTNGVFRLCNGEFRLYPEPLEYGVAEDPITWSNLCDGELPPYVDIGSL